MSPTLPFDRTQFQPGDRLCVALSGGADSVALLLTFHAQRESLGIGLSAVHVHHGLRGEEADADQRFVEDLCIAHDIPLHLHQASVPQRVSETRASGNAETIEEAARNLRYEIFTNLLTSGHADAVLTAHTLDDQAETVLMKLLRGAWTEGLSAIHPTITLAKGKILRPFLQTRRSEIEAYLTQLNQPWRNDSTNTDTAYTRNRIRRELLPQLRTYNPNLDQTLANMAELAREEETRWQTELNRLLPQLLLPGKPVRGGGRAVSTTPGQSQSEVSIELDRLHTLDPALRRRVLRAAARRLGARLTFDETARLLALCGFRPYPAIGAPTVAARTGSTLHLPSGLRADRSPRELRLYREV
ncbi:tRNA lysidine(34) synthetase TilS [Tunturiibacter gelidoferens]|uniref:tRNA(Ile)-lysidine synthase n=1 Tax=Tunturiibacter gelidiferens TaxID=3069689 RepID=A0ACC5NY95_9BACT|nr:tRNA lysidine(34) synthetase TilS [Edaphobacter lichenicola]MBB5339535.1 tRNA(Ile)-lysidine synthase [Edaphobacter lichenicola]